MRKGFGRLYARLPIESSDILRAIYLLLNTLHWSLLLCKCSLPKLFLMKNFTPFLFLCFFSILLSCSKDDDNLGPDPNNSFTFPNTVTYNYSYNTELLLWVSGTQVNSEGLSPNDIIRESMEYEVPEFPTVFTFYPDSVEIESPDSTVTRAYRFSNDSLFITVINPFHTFEGQPMYHEMYLGSGSPFAFTLEYCTVYWKNYLMYVKNTFLGNYNFESIHESPLFVDREKFFSDPSDMLEGDTVMIYNQEYFFN